MALPRKYLADSPSGAVFKLLSTPDLGPTQAVIGPSSSIPNDVPVFGGYDGKTLVDSGIQISDLGGTVHTKPDGALDGDGSSGDPLGVRVDGITVGISACNELEVLSSAATVSTSPTGALDGDGSVPSPLAVRVDGVTVQINASNELESTGVGGTVVVSDGLSGIGTGGDPVRVLVDNETIGIDSNNKLEVIQPYVTADGNLGIGTLLQGTGGHHASAASIGTGLSLAGNVLSATGDGFWTIVTATIDQDIASNTTPATDNELFFTMVAGAIYEFEAYIAYSSPAGGGTPDIKYNFNGPATLTGQYNIVIHALTTADTAPAFATTTVLTTTSASGTASTPRLIRGFGWAYSTGGGVGSSGFVFQWSQNTSGTNATRRLAGSCLRYRRVANG